MKAVILSVPLWIVLLAGIPARLDALYIDPGTGSIVLQVMIGGLLAAVATTRLYWNRLRSFFRREKKAK
jgi:hypothetical protein